MKPSPSRRNKPVRRVFPLVLCVALFAAPRLKADIVFFQDFSGTPSQSVPAYYPIQGCTAGTCVAVQTYPFTFTGNTVPATVYIGDPAGFISAEITATVAPATGCTGIPALQCAQEFTTVEFGFTAGLDLSGSPQLCSSVGACTFTYDYSVQDVGVITWAPGLFTPPALYGDTTTVEFQYLTPEPSEFLTLSLCLAAIALIRGSKKYSAAARN